MSDEKEEQDNDNDPNPSSLAVNGQEDFHDFEDLLNDLNDDDDDDILHGATAANTMLEAEESKKAENLGSSVWFRCNHSVYQGILSEIGEERNYTLEEGTFDPTGTKYCDCPTCQTLCICKNNQEMSNKELKKAMEKGIDHINLKLYFHKEPLHILNLRDCMGGDSFLDNIGLKGSPLENDPQFVSFLHLSVFVWHVDLSGAPLVEGVDNARLPQARFTRKAKRGIEQVYPPAGETPGVSSPGPFPEPTPVSIPDEIPYHAHQILQHPGDSSMMYASLNEPNFLICE